MSNSQHQHDNYPLFCHRPITLQDSQTLTQSFHPTNHTLPTATATAPAKTTTPAHPWLATQPPGPSTSALAVGGPASVANAVMEQTMPKRVPSVRAPSGPGGDRLARLPI